MSKKNHKRFGVIAVEKGFITEDQLLQALSIQAQEDLTASNHRLIGQILLDLGFITEPQIEEVLEVINQQLLLMLATGR